MKIIALVILSLLAITVSSQAVIMVNDEFTIDMTEPNNVSKNDLVWEPADKVKQTDKGIIFENSAPNTSVDFYLLTKAYPIGLSWRPTYGANLNVELLPLRPSYSVFVRYSPDLKHWSSWHVLQEKHPGWIAKKEAGTDQHYIHLQIPLKERKVYWDYVLQYTHMDVPWQSDEEAAVKWLLTQEPDFFEKYIPFIGYIQFMCEQNMKANKPLSEMKISIGWGVGGLSTAPKNESEYQNRKHIPWRFKASDEKNKPRIE